MKWVFLLTFSLSAFSMDKDFCSRSLKDYKELIQLSTHRLSFKNSGGLLNKGVCWWHSRLQRSSLYLSVFKPEEPKIPEEEVFKVLKKWAKNEEVIEISGYKNMNEFSLEYKDKIQNFLNNWQIQDSLVRGAWIRGLSGKTKKESSWLHQDLLNLKHLVEEKNHIVFQMLQLPGIPAHAWLVKSVSIDTNKIKLEVIDSNFSETRTEEYLIGEKSLKNKPYGSFVPYTQREGDFKRILKSQRDFCDGIRSFNNNYTLDDEIIDKIEEFN